MALVLKTSCINRALIVILHLMGSGIKTEYATTHSKASTVSSVEIGAYHVACYWHWQSDVYISVFVSLVNVVIECNIDLQFGQVIWDP
jgi:hypothetical protein